MRPQKQTARRYTARRARNTRTVPHGKRADTEDARPSRYALAARTRETDRRGQRKRVVTVVPLDNVCPARYIAR